jgi:putative membrane protein
MEFIGTWLVGAIAVAVSIWLVPGINVVGGAYAGPIFTALFLAIVNACIKPVLKVIGLPFTIITLGLFSLVINAFMLELASFLSRNITHNGITIDSFGAAFIGAIVVSVVTMILSGIIK